MLQSCAIRVKLLSLGRKNHVNQNYMMHRFLRLPLGMMLLLFLGLHLASCNKFEGEQTIPAYIQIDSISLITDYFTQGSNSKQITDAWIYVNDQLVGAFEMPAKFPVLAQGKQKLEIRPGIKLNGIAATRVPYPFYKPIIIQDFNFIPDSVQKVRPSTSYYSTAVFAWIEDFEDVSISLEGTSQSDTAIYKTQPANNPEAWLSQYSSYSGIVSLDSKNKVFKIATFNAFTLPGSGTPVLLELDYKCDRAFGVGMFATISGQVLDIPLVVVNSSATWNKIYVNLGPNISAYPSASNFKIYFESSVGDDEQSQYYLDNIKLIYRAPNS